MRRNCIMSRISKKKTDSDVILSKLLKEHKYLEENLKDIPFQRKMTCQLIEKDGKIIGKPRFQPPVFKWDQQTYSRFVSYLRDARKFLDQRHYWYDNTIKDSLKADRGRDSKKSVIFLLERDVWCTDEVYGDYLIEYEEEYTIISYFRRNERRRTFRVKLRDTKELQEWLMDDARRQISRQFQFLWDAIRLDLETCEELEPQKTNTKEFITQELYNQFLSAKEEFDKNPILGFLGIGRIAELWVRERLPREQRDSRNRSPRREALNLGLISKDQYKLLNEIATNYNQLKHRLDFNPELPRNKKKLKRLILNFSKILKPMDEE